MLTYADVSGEYPVLKIDTAAFIVRKIGQETAMPSAGKQFTCFTVLD
jgi:hypothetical protein